VAIAVAVPVPVPVSIGVSKPEIWKIFSTFGFDTTSVISRFDRLR
jgi:hypothetical protein